MSRSARRLTTLLATIGAGAALVLTLAGPAMAAPPNPGPKPSAVAPPTGGRPGAPSDAEINQTASERAAAASAVGQKTAEVAAKQAQIDRLTMSAQIAEQKFALARQRQQQAEAAYQQAEQDLTAARAEQSSVLGNRTESVRASYMAGSISGLSTSLLTASDPTALLQRSDYEQFLLASLQTAIDAANRAALKVSNAEARARGAKQNADAAAVAALQAQQDAVAARDTARVQGAQLRIQLVAVQSQLNAARVKLAAEQGQRAAQQEWDRQRSAYTSYQNSVTNWTAANNAYQSYVQEQARLAREAQQRAQAAGGGGAPSAPSNNAPPPNPHGGWTPQAGQAAVNRAAQFLGWPYSFAAGNASGPTYGVAVDYDSRNDGGIVGFDCSGLVMYAWGINWVHFAATQYTQAGSFHPSVGQLLPGDLVFWSGDGTIDGIGHVAIYIGGGNVIQAPQSGDIIRITPLFQVESGYYGATRPLT